MANNDIVANIMANLRELHPELTEGARVKLEWDLRRLGRRQPLGQEEKRTAIGDSNRSPTPRADRSPRGDREPLGFADLGEGFNPRR